EAIEDVGRWIAASERLEAVSYQVELLPARPGESTQLRRDLEVRFLPGRHRVPSVGHLICEGRNKLPDELARRPAPELAALRARGVEVTRREETPLLAYPGDCGAEIFEAAPELFSARVLLIECSFLLPEDVERARRYGHLHLHDFLERADLFRNDAI